MKTFNIAVLSLALVGGLAAAQDAGARGRHGGHHHHHGSRVGVFIGAPLFPYYYSPYYYSPYSYPGYYPPAVVAAQPPVYIEQGGAPATAAPSPAQGRSGRWYFCQDSQTYYPYVQQCASPWQEVMPQASASPQ
jgi:hypothetical protein